MLFVPSGETFGGVEDLVERVTRLIAEAVARGQFKSEAEVIREVGKSTGWWSERKKAQEEATAPGINSNVAVRLAKVLNISLSELFGEEAPPPDDDADSDRSWAVSAARALQFPESAIHAVQAEPALEDSELSSAQRRLYWFHRIEAEASRATPSTSRRHKG